MTSTAPSSQRYDAHYYATGCGTPMERNALWLLQFARIADRIVSDIQPKSVMDAGCAMGFLVEQLRNRGVEAWGIDLSEYAISQVYETARPFCSVGSVTTPLGRRYDLITCIEVLEHLPKDEAEAAIANFCAHTDDVIFSSSPSDIDEPTHVNVQTPEYWAEQFARHGLYHDFGIDLNCINPWAVRFKRTSTPAHHLVWQYEHRLWQAQQECHALRAEMEGMRQLIHGYESGRFIRIMGKLKRWTSRPA
jgi:SAM-dependent methyltransferase